MALLPLVSFSACKIKYDGQVEDRSSSSSALSDASPKALSFSRQSPAISVSASADGTPIITGALDRSGNIAFYRDDSCQSRYGIATSDSSGNFSFSGIQFTTDATYKIYYKTYDPSSQSWGTCLNTGVGYRYQAAPKISFARTAYTVDDQGDWIGPVIQMTRDVGGIANTVTITREQVTARDTLHLDIGGNGTVTFSDSDSDLTQTFIPAGGGLGCQGDICVANTGHATDVDRYVTMRITDAGVNGAIGTDSITQVNIIDLDTAGEYWFTHSFYSATDSSSTASLVVQRKTVGLAASINISFVDGSAVGGADYDSTTVTANFGAGDDEATITVPIYNVTSNKSFYAKIVATAASQIRAQSIAKVRILDSAESTSCINLSGTGTQLDPYLICSADDFPDVDNQSGYFKLMADIDGSSITPLSSFKGNFDGNEHIISRFTYTGSGVDSGIGLISALGGLTPGGSSVKNLNMLYYNISSIANIAGPVAAVNGDGVLYHPATLAHIHTSGYLEATNSVIGGVQGWQKCGMASTSSEIHHVLSSGYLSIPGQSVGGLAARINCDSATMASFELTNIYNTASQAPDATSTLSGGIVGELSNYGTATAYKIEYLENRGSLGSDSYGGGIFGTVEHYGSPDISSLTHYGAIVGGASEYFGGLVGSWTSYGNVTMSGLRNFGAISSASNYTAGMLANINVQANGVLVDISDAVNYGSVTNSLTYTAGLVASFSTGNNSVSFQLSGSSNYGAIQGASTSGGLVGEILTTGAVTGHTYSIGTSSNTGAVTSTGFYTGGILAKSAPSATDGVGGSSLTISDTTNTGTISGGRWVGGIMGAHVPTANFGTLALTNVSSNANISNSNSSTGGIVGYIGIPSASVPGTVTITNPTVSGNLGATAGLGGIIGSMQFGGAIGTGALTISEANSSAVLTGTSASGVIGGLIGTLSPTALTQVGSSFVSTITSSKATGSITNTTAASTRIGGLIGYSGNGGIASLNVMNCYSSGGITGSNSSTKLGGLIGHLSHSGAGLGATIEKVYSTHTIGGGQSIGGIVGQADMNSTANLTIRNAYATGSLTTTNASNYLGGILGQVSGNGSFTVLRNYSLAELTTNGATMVGGIFGQSNDPGLTAAITVTDSFWRKDVTYNTGIVTDARAKTDAQLLLSATYTGATWDLGGSAANIWQMSTYPFLSNMP